MIVAVSPFNVASCLLQRCWRLLLSWHRKLWPDKLLSIDKLFNLYLNYSVVLRTKHHIVRCRRSTERKYSSKVMYSVTFHHCPYVCYYPGLAWPGLARLRSQSWLLEVCFWLQTAVFLLCEPPTWLRAAGGRGLPTIKLSRAFVWKIFLWAFFLIACQNRLNHHPWAGRRAVYAVH